MTVLPRLDVLPVVMKTSLAYEEVVKDKGQVTMVMETTEQKQEHIQDQTTWEWMSSHQRLNELGLKFNRDYQTCLKALMTQPLM